MIFEEILGNEQNKVLLNNLLTTGNITHSYMFVGPNSIGKKLFAKEFAKGILCNNQGTQKPCYNCTSCNKIKNNNHPDLFILDEKEETIKNEQIREINKKILEKPIEGTKKIYIINNSENMTVQAQNSLLKTLEEPPTYAIIILITKNENAIINTVKSRCMKINFHPLKAEHLKTILEQQYKIENLTEHMLELVDGSIEKAVQVFNNADLYQQIESVFTNIEKTDIIDFINQKEKILKDKEEIKNILEFINAIFYKLSKTNIKYINCIQALEQVKTRLKRNSNYDITIDNLLFTIWEEIND